MSTSCQFLCKITTLMFLPAFAGLCFATADAADKPAASEPEVWMCFSNPKALGDASRSAEWEFVSKNLDGLKVYIDSTNHTKTDVLKDLLTVLKKNDIKLAIECGGPLGGLGVNDTIGERSAFVEMKKMDRIFDLGFNVDYLDVDGSVSRTLKTGRHRWDFKNKWKAKGFDEVGSAVAQAIEHMRIVGEHYPETDFWALCNFPNWGWKKMPSYHARYENRQDWGDYHVVLENLIPAARKEGVRLRAVTVDTPYQHLMGLHKSVTLTHPEWINWLARLRDLEDYVHAHGLEFNLIINTELSPSASDKNNYENCLEYIRLYREAGGAPERYLMQSWKKYPTKLLPETEPYTMTNLTKAVIEMVKGEAKD